MSDPAEAGALAERLLARLARPHQLGRVQVHSGVSMGIVLGNGQSTVLQLLRDADTAMYEAKRRGRGRYVHFEPGMHEQAAAAQLLESELRTALRRGQLRVVYQPIIEIGSGRTVGMEALARWHHPIRGEVSPVRFVPVAEESGLIVALGEEILRQACEQFRAWQAAGLSLPPRVSVNLSRAQLTDPALPSRVAAIVSAAGLACNALQFEVTESLAMQDEAALGVLHALRALGVQLALDDFGTGHSSLAALRQLPVQQVKIDRSFIQGLETSPYHRALVQAALQVANALQLELVAEGIESESQARLLAELGCSRGQGYLFARPLEADAMADYLRRAPQPAPAPALYPLLALAEHTLAHQIVITDSAGLTLFVNPAFSLNTGYTLADMQGRKPGALLQGQDTAAAAARQLHEAVTSGQGCLGVEIMNYRKDGSAFWVLVDIVPVRDSSGQIERFVSVQTEITAQRQAWAELGTLRERVVQTDESGLVGYWERDLDSGQGQADATGRRLFGVPAGAAVPAWSVMLDRLTPETRPALQHYFDELKAGAERGMLEYSVRHDDGQVLHLQTYWTRQDRRVQGVIVDVSGTQQLRREREQLLSQLEMAALAADQLFWRHDLASDQLLWLPGKSAHLPAGNRPTTDAARLLAAVLPQDRHILIQARSDALHGGRMVEATYRLVGAAGTVRHVLTRRIGLRDAEGRVRQVVGVSIDITAERDSREALCRLAQQNALLLEAAKMATFRLDLRQWTMSFGPAFARLYGLAPSCTTLGWTAWLGFVHPEHRELVRGRVEALATGHAELSVALRFRALCGDGQIRWIESQRSADHDEDGRLVAMFGAHRDISGEILAAQTAQALAAERAARAERTLLLAGASHGLRTPLNAVLGFARLLRTGHGGPLDARALDYLAQIEDAGAVLLRLRDDFSQLSALDGGAAPLHLGPVLLPALLQAVTDLLGPQALAAGITLQAAEVPVGACVLADEQRLRQALLNLVGSAIKYNRLGGEVQIRTLRCDGRWQIAVRDTGLDMDAGQLARLFTAFERVGRETSGIAGSGLGLLLSRGWVRAMGGEIHVTSQPGEGSVFTVDLPVAD